MNTDSINKADEFWNGIDPDLDKKVLKRYMKYLSDPYIEHQITEDAECEIVPPPTLPEPELENGSEAREDNDRQFEQDQEQYLLSLED